MIVRIVKGIMLVIMIVGIAFSIVNFVANDLKAQGKDGYDLWVSGVNLCPSGGEDCKTSLGTFPVI